MVQHWMAVAVLLCGCGKSEERKATPPSGPQEPAKPPRAPRKVADVACDPAQPVTEEWALAQYVVETNDTRFKSVDYVKLEEVDADGVVALIEWNPFGIKDRTPERLGQFFQCQRYTDRLDLVGALLLHRGWATADAKKRAELALELASRLAFTISKPDEHWDPAAKASFTAPTTEVLPDGGIKITRWVREMVWYSDKGPQSPKYDAVKQSQRIDGKGEVFPAIELDRHKY